MLVAGVMVLLLVVPYALARHSTAGPGVADRASTAPAGPGYAFLAVNPSGTPVRWNPCQPIYYQMDLAAAPSWAQTDIAHAIEEVSSATGIDFVYSGRTSLFPTSTIPLGTDGAPSPVVIAWATEAQSRTYRLAPTPADAAGAFPGATDALGRTVPVAATDPSSGRKVYVTGTVVISAAASALPAGFGYGSDGVLLLHELGRLLGLGEVSDVNQVMSPQAVAGGVTGLGPGDQSGLARLGRSSGCLAVPAHASLFAEG